ncbi:Hypothetical predicted protein [Mytilus galloprovincialis]|uniref:G-protein coupled receptors family 2 profile 2 domain-containing protein n=1 Tax=Mytilus galloprovincialis TaxID=29158 RepID=A0A8B6DQW2_MYTGA|nr:Hypothetical predicted protein [Mytilus galloprovincialis]
MELPSIRVFVRCFLLICVFLSNGIVSFSATKKSSNIENEPQKEPQSVSSNVQDDFSVSRSSKVIELASVENQTGSQELDALFRNDPCANFSTCSFIAQTKTKFCNCDEDCIDFNDCCNGVIIPNATHVVNAYLRYECLKTNRHSLFDGVYVITKCPKTTNSADSSLCDVSSLLEVGPWVADEQGILYSNRYCAICNGVSVLTVLDVKITNVNSEILRVKFENLTTHEKLFELYYDKYTTVIYVIPPEVEQRYCLPTEISATASSQCYQYGTSPVEADMVTYKNMYCVPIDYTYSFCLGPGIDFTRDYGYGFDSMHPLTVLFSFKEPKDACQTQIKGLCESEETYTNARVELRFSIEANDTIEPDAFIQIAIGMVLSTIVPNITYLDYLNVPKNRENSSTLPLVNVILFIKSEMTLEEYITYPQILQNLKWKMIMKSEKSGKVIEMITDVNAQQSSVFNYLYEIYDTDVSSIIQEYSLQSHIFLENFPCTNISIDSFLNDSRHPHILSINTVACEDEQNDMQQNHEPNLMNEKDEYITYITYTGTCLSVISLICSVVVCRRSGLSTSIPGSNLENLSLALILANLLFLTGIGAKKYQNVCTVIGIVLHYLWLLVFSFMSISVIYLVYDVRRISISTTNKMCCVCAKHFLTIAGLLLPFVFVIPALFLEFIFSTTQFSPNYGGAICFPTAYPANLLFVSGPLMISVGLNLICITILTIYFNIKEGEASKIREGNYSQQIGIFLRLSVISGLFWITGTLSSVLQSEVLDYIFVVTCSLQGFLIAVANLTTKRVFRNKNKSLFRTSTRTLSRSSRILTRKPTGYPRKTLEKRRLSQNSSNSLVVASLS